jgi:hypothetical protein
VGPTSQRPNAVGPGLGLPRIEILLLVKVCGLGRVDLVQLFIEYGADVEKCRDEALVAATETGSVELVNLPLAYGPNLGWRDSWGRTARGWRLGRVGEGLNRR